MYVDTAIVVNDATEFKTRTEEPVTDCEPRNALSLSPEPFNYLITDNSSH